MVRKRNAAILVGLVVLAGVAFLAWRWSAFDFLDEAQYLRRLTMPPNGQSTPLSAVSESGNSVEVSWTIETEMKWAEYEDWLQTRLCEEYERLSSREGGSEFRCTRHGDLLLLSMRPSDEDGTRMRVKVVFRGSPR